MAFLQATREELLHHCVRASDVFASTLDYGRTLKNIATWLTPVLGHWLVIDLYDPILDVIRRISITHVDPSKQIYARELQRRSPPDLKTATLGPRHVIATGQPEADPDLSTERLKASIPDVRQLALMETLGIYSALCVPLKARNRILGALTWVSSIPERQHSTVDIPFGMEIASIAASHIENARLFWELKRSLDMRDHILRIVAHDLRNPLAAIQLNAELLTKKKEETDLYAPFIDRISQSLKKATDGMNSLIQDVTSFREIPRVLDSTLNLTPTDFDEIVQRTVKFLEPLTERRRIKITAVFGSQNEAQLDEDKLQTAISLLLENAVFSVVPGGELDVRTSQIADQIFLKISSHGQLSEPIAIETGISSAQKVLEQHSGHLRVHRDVDSLSFEMLFPANLKSPSKDSKVA